MSFHVYLLTDEFGSWPLLTSHALPWKGLRTPPLTLLPLGSFDLLDEALQCAAEFGSAARSGLIAEALEDAAASLRVQRSTAVGRWDFTAPSADPMEPTAIPESR
jgi:hypothetical protein